MYVYFILAPQSDCVKIGRAKNPETRLKALQTASPDELELLLMLPHSPPFEEHQLHKRFDKYRTQGEWFEYCGELKRFVGQKIKNPAATVADDAALCRRSEHNGIVIQYEYPKNDNKFIHDYKDVGYTDDCQRGETTPFKSPAYFLTPVWLNRDWDVWSPPSWSRTV